MKKLGVLIVAAVSVLGVGVATPAMADHDYYDRGGRGGHDRGYDRDRGGDEYGNGSGGDCRGGGCGTEREEDYGNNSCKYFCPAFDESPVHICLPGSTCNFDGQGGQDEGRDEGGNGGGNGPERQR